MVGLFPIPQKRKAKRWRRKRQRAVARPVNARTATKGIIPERKNARTAAQPTRRWLAGAGRKRKWQRAAQRQRPRLRLRHHGQPRLKKHKPNNCCCHTAWFLPWKPLANSSKPLAVSSAQRPSSNKSSGYRIDSCTSSLEKTESPVNFVVDRAFILHHHLAGLSIACAWPFTA